MISIEYNSQTGRLNAHTLAKIYLPYAGLLPYYHFPYVVSLLSSFLKKIVRFAVLYTVSCLTGQLTEIVKLKNCQSLTQRTLKP